MTRLTRISSPWSIAVLPRFAFLASALLGAAFAGGCSNSVSALSKDGGPMTGAAGKAGANGAAGANGTAGANGAAGGSGAAGAGGTVATKIPIGMTQCSDGKDNDGDGLIDAADPECTGPADNDEGSYATGIPGDNMDACKQDCFFDGNSGMGDDGCEWQLKCDPLSAGNKCPFDKKYADAHATECSVSASQPQHCIDFCRQFVPNGCDCFGCCAVPGAATAIRLDTTCTMKDLGDPTKCSPCTQVTQCMKPCGRCELCVGKDTVPADCLPDGGTSDAAPPPADSGHYGTPTCTEGASCTPGVDATCPAGFGCVTGCCLPIVQ